MAKLGVGSSVGHGHVCSYCGTYLFCEKEECILDFNESTIKEFYVENCRHCHKYTPEQARKNRDSSDLQIYEAKTGKLLTNLGVKIDQSEFTGEYKFD